MGGFKESRKFILLILHRILSQPNFALGRAKCEITDLQRWLYMFFLSYLCY